MSEANFDKQKHAEELFELSTWACYAFMVAEGLQVAASQMGDIQYRNCAAGAFGMMAHILGELHTRLGDAENNFSLAAGLDISNDVAQEVSK